MIYLKLSFLLTSQDIFRSKVVKSVFNNINESSSIIIKLISLQSKALNMIAVKGSIYRHNILWGKISIYNHFLILMLLISLIISFKHPYSLPNS